jgi:hypothetical protein
MPNDNVPHRVIYLHCGRYTTRVFGSENEASIFASGLAGATIQPASETPIYPGASRKLMDNSKVNERVPCKCGKGNRLRYEEHCLKCTSANNRMSK